MRHERQVEFLRRLAKSGEHQHGLFGVRSRAQPASAYTDPERFERERRVLFCRGPALIGLTGECASPGAYLTARFGRVPVLVIRQPDGTLRAMVNACRHRGAPLAEGTGTGVHRLVCGYHGWTYGTDGALRSRPLSHGAFDDAAGDCDLIPRSVAEKHGLIFVRPDSTESIDVDSFLAGASDDLGAFHLDGYVLVESRVREWKMNWKLLLDTFGEAYHIRTLHRETIAPSFDSGCTMFEAFGPHLVNIGFRKNIHEELAKPEEEQSLLPYGTIQYFLLPNAMLCHQVDHLELWRIEPIDVRTTRVTTSVFGIGPTISDKAERHLRRNLDLLLDVTGREHFPLMERIQTTLDSGVLPHVVFGRIEPALSHFHTSVEQALERGGLE